MTPFDQTLFGANTGFMLDFLRIWYIQWGIWLGLGLSIISAFVIFVDAIRSNISAMWWKVAAVVGVILVIPSLVLKLSPNDLAPKAVSSAGPELLVAFGVVGAVGALVALIALITYLAWGRNETTWDPGETMPAITPSATPIASTYPTYAPPTAQVFTPPPPQPTAAAPAPPVTTVMRTVPKELGMLIVQNGPFAGQTFKIGEAAYIGRDPERSEVAIDDPNISRQNCKIWFEEGQFAIQDMASTNGTLVNNERILKTYLKNGDEIQVGETHFAFVEIKTKAR